MGTLDEAPVHYRRSRDPHNSRFSGSYVSELVRKAETERDGTLEQVSVVCAT